MKAIHGVLALAVLLATAPQPAGQSAVTTAFTNAHVVGGTGHPDVANAVIVVRDGRIVSVGPASQVQPPAGARVVDLGGKFAVPGMISAHSHVSDVNGLQPRAYTEANTRRQLAVFARYGITSVWSLGGEQAPAFTVRDAQQRPSLDHARLWVSGDVIAASTPDEARQRVAEVAALRPDVIKIRVDDNLGTTTKMSPAVYRAVIDEAHARKLRVAAHIFYLEDAKDLVRAGADVIAHSVRDREVDQEFINLLRTRNIPYIPTLTRELSTFVYESTPAFFDDPFFLKDADAAVVASLKEPARQQAMRNSKSAQGYKAALPVASRNLKRLAEMGVTIAMGTDTGPSPERFQGYFEHLEMEMMSDAGMSAADVLRSATTAAALTMRVPGIGAIAPGAWADIVVLERDPRQDIKHTRSVSAVYVAGNEVKR
jgi:imidazolonepropionase-like amidohydrolase